MPHASPTASQGRPEQLTFFASLDFPGRTTLYLWEIAEKLGCTVKHLLEQVDSRELIGADISSATSGRRAMRIPVEAYRDYILRRLTGPADFKMQFLQELPDQVRREVILGLWETLTPPERRTLLRELSRTPLHV